MIKPFLKASAALLSLPIMIAGTAHADKPVQHAPYGNHVQNEGVILLFDDRDFRGDVREVSRDQRDFSRLRFNDKTESIAVIGGQWEVCEHGDYRGRCVFVRYDVPDLREFGLTRKISSVRPVLEYTDAAHGLMFVRNRNGEVRYADNNLGTYGGYSYSNYNYGYTGNYGSQLRHYGYSPSYSRYGFYNPSLGYGPYGFGYSGVSDSYRYRYGQFHPSYRGSVNPAAIARLRSRNNNGHIGVRRGDLTLFEHSNRNGVSLGTNRSIRDLSQYGFNDVGSSLRIREGRWEVCEHANFRGRCEIVDASSARLDGFNDRISSIRRIDGNRGRDDDDRRRRDRDYDDDDRRDDRRRRPRHPYSTTDINAPAAAVNRNLREELRGGRSDERLSERLRAQAEARRRQAGSIERQAVNREAQRGAQTAAVRADRLRRQAAQAERQQALAERAQRQAAQAEQAQRQARRAERQAARAQRQAEQSREARQAQRAARQAARRNFGIDPRHEH